MTDTSTQTTADLRMVDPAILTVAKNVREAKVTREFVSSIKQHGVLTPIVAVVQDDGTLVVRMGHRRTLAAVEAGRDLVPVYVVPADDADEAGRIVEQITENEHRADLTAAEKADAIEQLSLLGLSAAQIARRTSTKRAEVEAATAVAKSESAKKALAILPDLSLEDAAILAEFADDEEATESLIGEFEDGGSGALAHEASRQRDERRRTAAEADAAREATKAGLRVLTREEARSDAVRPLYRLHTPEGKRITAEDHAGCPGHAVQLRAEWQPNEDGTWPINTEPYCAEWASHGHTDGWESSGGGSKKKAADMSEEERESAKAERRDVIESNKAWKAAEPVRRKWVIEHLTRKTLPKGGGVFIAQAITHGNQWLSHYTTPGITTELLYAGKAPAKGTIETLPGMTDGRAQVIALGHCAAAAEASAQGTTWRSPNGLFTAYLTYLIAQGYTPSDVEVRAADLAKTKKKAKNTSDD